MKIQYLGTAAAEGWPALFCCCPACTEAVRRGGKSIRTRSQAVIDDCMLIDFPPDSYMHMLLYGVDLPHIETCLITHTHDDHFYDRDLLMHGPYFATHPAEKPLMMYGNDEMVRRIEAMKNVPEDALQLEAIRWKELQPFTMYPIGGYSITPLLARHKRNERCYNYLVERDGKRLLYAHDTAVFHEETWTYLETEKVRLDLVSLDCTFVLGYCGTSHMGIKECNAVRTRLLENGCAHEKTIFVLNHFSHVGGLDEQGNLYLHEEIEEIAKTLDFVVSYDGCIIEF